MGVVVSFAVRDAVVDGLRLEGAYLRVAARGLGGLALRVCGVSRPSRQSACFAVASY